MKAGHAHITLVVDRSGSMETIRDDAEGGVNAFIKAHKEAPGTCSFLLEEFDDQHSTVFDFGDVQKVKSYKLVPRGSTALFDAVGRAIVKTGTYLGSLPENERPEKVIFVVQTDGHENASKEYTWEKVQEMVKHQTEVYSWEFLFLGAELSMAQHMGFTNTFVNSNTGASYAGTYVLASQATTASRGFGSQNYTYTSTTILPDGTLGPKPDDPDAGVTAKV